MRLYQLAALVTVGSFATFGFSQAAPGSTGSQTPSTQGAGTQGTGTTGTPGTGTPGNDTQGTGNQSGAGTGADNSSNGGSGSNGTMTQSKHHKHHKKQSGTQPLPSTTGGTAPGAPNNSPQ